MRLKTGVFGVVLLAMAGWIATAANPQAPAPKPEASPVDAPAEAPIRAAFDAFAKAYNSEKTADIVALFEDDASIVDSDGNETKGKVAITAMYTAAFEETEALKLESKLESIKFLTPDVARVEGRSLLSNGQGDGNEYTRFSALMVKKDGKWKAAELRDYPVPLEDVPSYDRLKELEWMVGDWVDESDNNRVTSSVRWNEGKSYLVRNYHVELDGVKAHSGTMFIGWSPQVGQITSWVFDSEGGHGEGAWTRLEGNSWVIKSHGVLRDGKPTSATQVHVLISKDAMKTSSVDRIVGGVVAPDIKDILMVRKAPTPAAGVKPVVPAPK